MQRRRARQRRVPTTLISESRVPFLRSTSLSLIVSTLSVVAGCNSNDDSGDGPVGLSLTDVTATQVQLRVNSSRPIYADGCRSITLQGLEPGQGDWLDFSDIPVNEGGYVDGTFYQSLGCDYQICLESLGWRVSRQKLQAVGQVYVGAAATPPETVDAGAINAGLDAGAIDAGDGGGSGHWLIAYQTRTLTGRVRVELHYSVDSTCEEGQQIYQKQFDLGQ